MTQLTLRLSDRLAGDLKAHAAASGRSVNAWITAVLAAAVDPELAGDEAARTRARLARAGLVDSPGVPRGASPDPRRVAAARRAAARGTALSRLVSEGRG